VQLFADLPTGMGPVRAREITVQLIRSLIYGQAGQTTAEYSLVLLVAALIVGVFAAFVKGDHLSDMFQTIIEGLIRRADG
jgi:Protein of unknown function (DUF4244)